MLLQTAYRQFFIGMTLCASLTAYGQAARIVLNDNAWVRIDNGAWVVIEDPANTGIQTLGAGGNIRSEGEFNRIRWQIRNSTGAYILPFTTANGVKMPFTYEPLGGASNEAQASICFSTYNYGPIAGTNWDNNTYRPSDVTHMHNYYLGPPSNNSDNVVDRFWIVDPYAASAFTYSARPSIRLGFTYDPGAATGDVRTGNAISGASAVGAQRFNPGPQWWGDFWPAGTWAAGPVNSVTNVNAMPADFFRSWTLSNILQPLPVELLRFDARCVNAQVRLSWATGSERDASHFVIERGADGMNFEEIGLVAAAGSMSTMTEYAFTDERPVATGYYRIRMVDANGAQEYSPVAVAPCSAGPLAIVNAWDAGNMLQVIVSSPRDQDASFRLFDASGKLVQEQRALRLQQGLSTFTCDLGGIANSVYLLSIHAEDGRLSQRVPVY